MNRWATSDEMKRAYYALFELGYAKSTALRIARKSSFASCNVFMFNDKYINKTFGANLSNKRFCVLDDSDDGNWFEFDKFIEVCYA